MLTADQLLKDHAEAAGWSGHTQLLLALEFITREADLEQFERFLETVREEETAATSEEEA